jgi:putative CocE/NonD family hydrolase
MSTPFQEWVAHPVQDAYWDAYNPTAQQLASLTLPILTITGMYDDDQPGALTYYREYMKNASAEGRARHWLVIGPWDHAGTRTPRDEVGGVKFGPASLLDIPKLHLDWYRFAMQDGPKPEFLKKPVAYYVTGAETWRYADTLDTVTAEMRPMYLASTGGAATDVMASGALKADKASGNPDHYLYDPNDVSVAALEAQIPPELQTDQQLIYARSGHQLVYHTAPFEQDVELSGVFRFKAWIAINQPDTDFMVHVYEIRQDGSSIPLSGDLMRARYREGEREGKLVKTHDPLLYDFNRFTFMSRLVKKGSRLRLVLSPAQSINMEKNYNSGGVVAEETSKDGRPVTVTLFHDSAHPSALYLPVAAAN